MVGRNVVELTEQPDGRWTVQRTGTPGSRTIHDDSATALDQAKQIAESFPPSKVVIVNAPSAWEGQPSVKVSGGSEAELTYHAAIGNKAAWAVVRNPAVAVGTDWTIEFPVAGGPKTEL